MRIATRLLIALGLAVAVVMAAYAFIALRHRGTLLADALARETETLADALQITANNALRDGRLPDIDRVLARVTEDPETYAAAVLSADGSILAGGPAHAVECLDAHAPVAERPAEARGWAECGGRVRWVALRARPPASGILVARRTTVIAQEAAASRGRMLLTTLALTAGAGLAILLVLRTTLSSPLAEVMRGVQTLGGPNPPTPVRVPRAAGEIGELAEAFNEMAERLEGKRQTLVREAEERVELERRLRHSEKFAALGRLTGGLAHELGSPLNVIGVRAESVLADPTASPSVRRQAEEVLVEVERVARLIRGLSQAAREEPLDLRPVDVAELARSAANGVRERLSGIGARLDLDLPDSPLIVPGDEALLRTALTNLLVNAAQGLAGAPGDRVVALSVRPEDGEAAVVVEDSGRGVEPRHLERVFEPFFTTREVGEGMGLGLPIALGIVEAHGGTLGLERREAGGVRATLRLPVEAAVAGEGA